MSGADQVVKATDDLGSLFNVGRSADVAILAWIRDLQLVEENPGHLVDEAMPRMNEDLAI